MMGIYLHIKLRGNQSTGSGEEGFLKGFYHIWAWPPSWSCDPDAGNKLCSPYPMRLNIKFGFDWLSGFREEDV